MSSAGISTSTGTPTPACGLRERKKRRTRDALIHAALDLFRANGYERTTVREITDAVEVSERTFFRYFASKEELVLSFVTAWIDQLVGELRNRPPAERPVEALRNALRVLADRITQDQVQLDQLSYVLAVKLIETTPALLAANLMLGQRLTEQVVQIVGEREGVDPKTDPRPTIIGSVFCGLMAAASHTLQGEGGAEAVAELADTYLATLVPTFTEPWR